MSAVDFLVRYRKFRVLRYGLLLLGIEIPAEVAIGQDFTLVHRGMGTVIHPRTRIGDRVTVYHQVTIGRRDAHRPERESTMETISIGDDVVLFPGAKVLGGPGITVVGNGTVVAANAVLMSSTGEYEVWAGVPARMVGSRDANVGTR